ncbi:MAG: glycosyl transferase family 1 [Methylomonas sp.]|jgi:glycosyltransferase involved in cell wall biosynthesis|nr:MAG: glycosyl transferase family 1 [Methylomonas sp.]
MKSAITEPRANNSLSIGLVGPLPPPFGGMANQTNQLASLLKSEGIQVVLVQTNPPYPNLLLSKIKGVRALLRLPLYVRELWKVTAQVDCLHVMANSGWSWQLFAAPAIWIGWLRGVPVVVNYRGGEAAVYLKKSIRFVSPTLNKCSALIVPSPFLKGVFERFGFSAEVIPNVVDLNRFTFNARRNVHDIKSPIIVITRNLEEIYGIEVAINAIAIVRNKFPGIKVFIAGSGPLEKKLIALAEDKGLVSNIVFTGKLTPDEVSELYRKADIMLNPTTVDNMPNSVLEALACGLAVVSTNVGGIPYIVQNEYTALLVEINDFEMMADKIEQLINDPKLYEKLVFNGRSYVEQYGWNIVKDQWLDLYNRLIA